MPIKLISWNVNGLRARMKAGFESSCKGFEPDIICLQETKVLPHEIGTILDDYYCYLNPAERRGYSGTGLCTKEKPRRIAFGFPSLKDREGRIILAEYEDFVLVNVYTPNSKEDLSRLKERGEWDKEFARVCASISKSKSVIITGDLNVAHKPIDVHNPSNKTWSAGFTAEERKSFDNLLSGGFTDTFRYVNGNIPGQYSYFSYFGNARINNVGWRLDYFLVTEDLLSRVIDAGIGSNIGTSDHCPIALTLRRRGE